VQLACRYEILQTRLRRVQNRDNPLESALDMTAQLRFARCGANTVIERSYATNPLKLFTTRGVSPACWVYAATYGGGIVGGDAIGLEVEAAAGARAIITTQASTKVYRSLRPASQDIKSSVDDDALLVVLPDPVVCFAGGDFSQRQRYELAERASLVLVDWMTSGRHASGERWAFHHYSSRIDIRRAHRHILYDTLWLDAEDGPIAERLAGFEVCLTAVITGPLVAEAAAAIVRSVAESDGEDRHDFLAAAWRLPDGGALLRINGVSVEQVSAVLRERLAFLGALLGDDPFSRKW
jgi:urease accessory protein